MARFSDNFRGAAARFLSGRNGADELNRGLLVLYILLVLLRVPLVLLFPYTAVSAVFSLLLTAVAATILCRLFSRNLGRRQAENARFLRWWRPRGAALAAWRGRRMDRDHRYFRCRSCKTLCRVPRGRGRIQITCPRCRSTMVRRS